MSVDPPSAVPVRGLGEAEAQARLKAEGYNELPRADRRTALRIVLEVLREPMLALLFGGMVKGKPPIAAGQSRFLLVALVGTGALTTWGVYKALESPDRP